MKTKNTNLLILSAVLLAGIGPQWAPAQQAFNVLFLFADDQRADTIAALGNPVIQTPNLDRLARRGVAFNRAYMQGGRNAATCVPSRAMLLSGQNLFHIDESLQRDETWPAAFGRANYTTFMSGKWHNGEKSIAKSFQMARSVFAGGMTDPMRAQLSDLENGKLTAPHIAPKHACEIFANEAIRFIREHKGGPFFCYVPFDAPHDPHIVPPDFPVRYELEKIPAPPNFLPWHPWDNGEMTIRDEQLLPWPRTTKSVRAFIAEYYRYISFLDAQIGRVLDALEASPYATNTIIVFSADSGVARGSHGLIGKQNLYELDSVRVPLIICGPGIPAGQRTDAMCYLFDVMPTLGKLCGVAAPKASEGISFDASLKNPSVAARSHLMFAYKNVQRAVRDDRWKLIRYPMVDRTQLFDLQNDPYEVTNLAGKPEHMAKVLEMTALLEKEMKLSGDTAKLVVPNPKLAEWTPPTMTAKLEDRITVADKVDRTASPSKPSLVYTLDMRPLNNLDLRNQTNANHIWDTMHTLAALQGLANRKSPRLFMFYCKEFGMDTDQFWFDWLRGEDGWLKDAEIKPLSSLEETITAFREFFRGLVVYDPAVPATSNAASTVAGCEDLLPVRYDTSPDSVFNLLTIRLKIPVKRWLLNPDGTSMFSGKGRLPDFDEPSSGSAKTDVYRWARKMYLKPGQCDAGFTAYYIDAFWLRAATRSRADMHTLSNHDFFISHKAFFWDLSPWADECPNDDLNQPLGLDRRVFLEVLQGLYDQAGGRMIKVGGFPPWPFKYTTHGKAGKHDGVPTEWEFGRLISQYNGYMEADAAGLSAMANASFYTHYPLAKQYPRPSPKPSLDQWKSRGYVNLDGKVSPKLFVGHYVGDYDSPSWLYKAVPAFFRDPSRGQIPLGWAFDPNLSDRAPQALVYAYRHATTNDFFIAGDSGAGYLNVRGLTIRPESGLPSGLNAWIDHCQKYYRLWDMSISGFILDGSGGAATDVEFAGYRKFSPDGFGTHFEKGPALHLNIPSCPEKDLPASVEAAAAFIANQAMSRKNQPAFLWARSILKSPRWYSAVSLRLKETHPEAQVEVVDPYTFFGLIKLVKTND